MFFNPGLESGEMLDVCAVATIGDIDEDGAPERNVMNISYRFHNEIL